MGSVVGSVEGICVGFPVVGAVGLDVGDGVGKAQHNTPPYVSSLRLTVPNSLAPSVADQPLLGKFVVDKNATNTLSQPKFERLPLIIVVTSLVPVLAAHPHISSVPFAEQIPLFILDCCDA